MALTLVESAKLSRDNLQRGIIETFVQESVIMDRIPFLAINGNAYAYTTEGTLPGIEFRAVNSAYAESTGTVNQASEKLVILGGEADVDTFIQQTRSDLQDQRATQSRLKVKAAVYAYQNAFVNGDVAVDPNSFDGLKKRLVGSQVLSTPGANGFSIVGADDATRLAAFDLLDELLAAVPGINGSNGALIMNNLIRARFASAGRRAKIDLGSTTVNGKTYSTYQGIPMIDLGDTALGARILPQTETRGTSTASSSVYAVKYGEDEGDGGVTGLTNGGIMVEDLGKLQSKPAWRTRIEFFTGLAVFSGKAAARLPGALNA
jgi:hypothetical protein